MKVKAWIGLGSNLEQPQQQIKQALEDLGQIRETVVFRQSSLYQSAPMGPQDQPDYVNAVAEITTELTAIQLLRELQAIENQHGRVRNQHWGPRTLDLDLLVYAQTIINEPDLIVPHPGLAEREFVLYPLAEISPDLHIPGLPNMAMLIAACPLKGLKKTGLENNND